MKQREETRRRSRTGAAAVEWHSVRVRAADFDYLHEAAKATNLSVAAFLERLIKRDRSERTLHERIDRLGEQLQFFERSIRDITEGISARLDRIEDEVRRPPRIVPDGLTVEQYERFYLVMTFTHLRDLAVRLTPDEYRTAETRTHRLLDWLDSGPRK